MAARGKTQGDQHREPQAKALRLFPQRRGVKDSDNCIAVAKLIRIRVGEPTLCLRKLHFVQQVIFASTCAPPSVGTCFQSLTVGIGSGVPLQPALV